MVVETSFSQALVLVDSLLVIHCRSNDYFLFVLRVRLSNICLKLFNQFLEIIWTARFIRNLVLDKFSAPKNYSWLLHKSGFDNLNKKKWHEFSSDICQANTILSVTRVTVWICQTLWFNFIVNTNHFQKIWWDTRYTVLKFKGTCFMIVNYQVFFVYIKCSASLMGSGWY